MGTGVFVHHHDDLLPSHEISLAAVLQHVQHAKQIHFAGHGEYNERTQSAELIVNGHERLSAQELFTGRIGLSNPRLVTLTAYPNNPIEIDMADAEGVIRIGP